MDYREIELLINQSIKRLKDEYELLNITLLNALHRNIDIMIANAERWFGQDVPQEYRDVLNSLMTLTYLYCQEKADISSTSAETLYEEFKPDVFINSVITDMESVLGMKNVLVELDLSEATIRTSKKILRDSLLNVFLSMGQFMSDDSTTKIKLTEKPTTIQLKLLFENLGGNVPEMSKLSRVFYSYFDGADYRINIGLSVALENLRNIGVMVKVTRISTDTIEMEFSIPTTHFLETISQIQKRESTAVKTDRHETVLLCIDDVILEMVLSEALQEAGFSPNRGSISSLRAAGQSQGSIIADYTFLKKNLIAPEELDAIASNAKQLIIIHSNDESPALPKRQNVQAIKKPFEVDTIISALT